jgi:hypothetical protein
MRTATLLLAPFALLGACTTAGATADHQTSGGLTYARLGQTVTLGPKVTPLAVTEDSRCPRSVTCVWAGTVKLSTRVWARGKGSTVDLTLGKPQPVAGGSLELVKVTPYPATPKPIDGRAYSFGLRFVRGR